MKYNGQKPLGIKILDDKRFIQELIKKLIEESSEMARIKNVAKLEEELSDVIEIVNYLKSALQLSDRRIKELLRMKKSKNGGFDKKIYLNKVGTPNNNKWVRYYLENPDKYPEIKK